MISMRVILFAILVLIQGSTLAQAISFGNKAKVYLVRHAEKGTGQNKRSGDLMRELNNVKIA